MGPGSIAFSIVVFAVGFFVGMMCNEHANKRTLTTDEYVMAVRLITAKYNGVDMQTKLDELKGYMDDQLSALHELSAEVEMVVREVTNNWQ